MQRSKTNKIKLEFRLTLIAAVACCCVSGGLQASDWKPVPGHIMTRWADKVRANRPLSEYPRLTKWMKELDSSRLVSNASGGNERRVDDIVDAHSHPGPASPKIESERAAVLGEFGGLGLGLPAHAWVESPTWGDRAATGTRHLTRNYLELWRKTRQLTADSGLCAAVYTQLTDVETESNGLLTYDRKVEKVSVPKAAAAHRGKFSPPPTFVTVAPTAQSEAVNWRFTTNEPPER